MAQSKTVALLVFGSVLVFFCLLNESRAKPQVKVQDTVSFTNGTKPASNGICTLEVPTVDLLSAEDKRGVIPRGNGSRPGYSKIQVCCSGWTRKPHSAYHCEPACDNGCANGNCTAPNVCICLPGHTRDLDNNCIPTCPKGCLNGVCTLQGKCSCTAGYRLDPKGEFCAPYCSGGCGIGGNCTAPEVCTCKPGFIKDSASGKCGHHCEGGCPGGECIGPNQCSCAQGFVRKNNACEAQCPRGCTNGVCTAPNKCTCQPGWAIDQSGTNCQAHCAEPCLNGDCTAPNTCTCKQGYIRDPASPTGSRCVAHCPGGCENGQCSAPNFCICNPGFVKVAKGSNKCVKRTRRSLALHWELIPQQFN